jgi:hypothetical protein
MLKHPHDEGALMKADAVAWASEASQVRVDVDSQQGDVANAAAAAGTVVQAPTEAWTHPSGQ